MVSAAKVERQLLSSVASCGLAVTEARLDASQQNADALTKAGVVPSRREVVSSITTANGIERKVFACNPELRESLMKLRDAGSWSNASLAKRLEVSRHVVSRYLDPRGCICRGNITKLEASITVFLQWLSKPKT